MKKKIALILAVILTAAFVFTSIPIAAASTTAPPYFTDDTPVITGDQNDIVAKIYVGNSTVAYAEIKRSEFTTKFSNNRRTNILTTDSSLLDQNIKIEILDDIDAGESQCAFYVNPNKKLTVNGNDHILLGYPSENPVLRANSVPSDRTGGDIVFNDFDIYNPRASCFQYYTNGQIDINRCEWTSTTHVGIWATSTGDYAVLNINEGSVIKAGWIAINVTGGASNTGATININEGATVTCSGNVTINVGDDNNTTGAILLEIQGNVINTANNGSAVMIKDTAAGTIIDVYGGNINGDLCIVDVDVVLVGLAFGSIKGELEFDVENENVYISDEFIINGYTWGGEPSAETTTAPAEDTTTAPTEDTTTVAEVTTTKPSVTTTAKPIEVTTAKPEVMTTKVVEETTAEPDEETVAVPKDSTTPAPAPETEAQPTAVTTKAPESVNINLNVGCGGMPVAASLIALICALSAVFIIKKK